MIATCVLSVWMISNLDAPITAAATGQSVTAPPAGAAAGRGSESEQHLYVGIGVACDSCGLFGQPTGAALLALSTVPLPPVSVCVCTLLTPYFDSQIELPCVANWVNADCRVYCCVDVRFVRVGNVGACT